MSKTTRLAICLIVAALGVVSARGDAISEKRKAQNKLLAMRAARADAIRKLAERIKGLQITSQTRVQDFVAESDTIRTALDARLIGMKEVSVKHLEDGSCEVVMEIKLSQIIATLKSIHAAHYKGDKVKVRDFQQMTTTNKITIIRETGSGVPRPELMPNPLVPPAPGASQATFSGASAAARKYWAQYCTARGRLMAERAARVEAMRKLAERIKGVQVSSTTTVQDFVTESDEIRTRLNTYLRGMKEVGRRYHKDELVVEVEMQIKLRQFFQSMKTWTTTQYKGNKTSVRQIQDAVIRAKDTVITETGMGVPNERYLKTTTPATVRQTVTTAAGAPPWATQRLRVTGNSALAANAANAAQAKLMAKRAAELDGRRKLAEKISGLQITSNTSVQDFVAQNDQIGTSMLTFQQGAGVVDDSFKITDGLAEVVVEIEMLPLWNSILYYQRTLNLTIR
ncbi:MAG: LPP20 family lipoprotein [Phycisphaerae bacterium]|nr:LPP20 family lipoprotein [Phycisphaerae bacterium]